MLFRAFTVWLALLLIAIANGAFRDGILAPNLGSSAAHVISTSLLSLLIAVLIWLSAPWIRVRSTSDGVRVGVLWTTLVLACEFFGGHFLFGRSWGYLLADYNVFAGRIWILVPIVALLAPTAAGHLRNKSGNRRR
jgi:hypothetical protein